MLKTSLILTLLFQALSGAAQLFSYAELVRDAICSIRDEPVITYVDSSLGYYQPFSYFARKGRVEGHLQLRAPEKTAMVFTRAELAAIDHQMASAPPRLWPLQLFANSVRIPTDSTHVLPHYMRTTEFARNRQYRYYYHLSAPVSIRNGSVVIFRMAEMIHHSAGYDFLFIYVCEQQGWKRRMTIRAGAW
ncbi:hypothetical protein [Flaviaesturariibacter amylovorans]|uniref:Uncharacterized protein n=1 Tax=Flaviaesturariibacter amylovorans TaxID=1084520 RepID=A0ABP8HTP5_9BACT